ncbi:hypothetical protein FRC06_002591 [Ceratobasidium sp. 370]|nr:hypothetical protein FRC06_002591 [Ceratobasidium sp. 370]
MQRLPSSNDLAFATYDIIALICANAKYSDLAGFLTVSRGFFRCAAPHIWRQLPNAQPLLDLVLNEDRGAKKTTESADLPEDKSRLSRFEFYAPFVKELFLHSAFKKKPNWHSLSNAVSHRPLLPNLSRLILDVPSEQKYSSYTFGSTEDLACLNAFICPSLVDIRLPSGFSLWLFPDAASGLLKNVVDTAPELKVLHICIHIDMGNVDAAFRNIARFRNLRALKCTSVMIDGEKLRSLGTLPQLESLQIVSAEDVGLSDDEDRVPPGDWMLPAQSFPMLRHLSVYELPDSMVAQLWRLTSLVRSLVSVGVKFQSESSSSEIIRTICRCSPEMQELSLDLSDLDDQVVPATVVEHIRKLPLQRLRMLGTDIDELAPLLSSMTNLEYLEVDDYTSLTIEDLISIAKYMPKLRFLSSTCLDPDWLWEVESWDVEPHLVTQSPSTLCLVAEFHLSERFVDWNLIKKNSTMEEFLDAIARYEPTLSNF